LFGKAWQRTVANELIAQGDMMKKVNSKDTKRTNRLPPGQALVGDLPVLHYGSTQNIETKNWELKLFGAVRESVKLSFDAFSKLPQTELYCDIHCVTGWSRLDTTWEGVATSELKGLVDIDPEATHVMLHSEDAFTTNITIDEFFDSDVILATKFMGQPLTAEHGAPVRLILPKLYFYKSAKWIVAIEFMKGDRRGFWERYGYHNHGDPWSEERYGR